MSKLFFGLVLVFAACIGYTAAVCGPFQTQLATDFYNAVTNCSEDPNQAIKFRALLADDAVWISADNVTFVGGDLVAIYNCFPHSGVNFAKRIPIRQYCSSDSLANNQGLFNERVISENDLRYNLTKDPSTGLALTPVQIDFFEMEDFELVINPNWRTSGSLYLVHSFQSFASARALYIATGLLPSTIFTKRDGSTALSPFSVAPNSVITSAPISFATMLTSY